MDAQSAKHLPNVTTRGNLRAKVAKILEIMRDRGMDARIYSSLRSVEAQRELVRKGYSKTMKSSHLPGPDGLCSAVDIADGHAKPGPWDAPREFWVLLGRLALTQGMGWGGLFGLPLATKIKLVRFLMDRKTPFRAENWQGKLGWDVAHIEERPGWLDAIILKYVK